MPLTAAVGTVARTDSDEWVLPANPAGGRCATVTMLLAQKIARNDCWSVDDEPRYGSNKMNVWQTLEYLSSLSLRKRYNYEGFADTQHLIRTLTPSFRRDSYAERTKAEETTASNAAANVAEKYEDHRVSDSVAAVVATAIVRRRATLLPNENMALSAAAKVTSRRKHRCRKRTKQRNSPELDAEYALTEEDLQDLVKCT